MTQHQIEEKQAKIDELSAEVQQLRQSLKQLGQTNMTNDKQRSSLTQQIEELTSIV